MAVRKRSVRKSGSAGPDNRQSFDTPKEACKGLQEESSDFSFLVNTFFMQHSSVNGLVDEKSVDGLAKLVLGHSIGI